MRTHSRRRFLGMAALAPLALAATPASAAQLSPEQVIARLDGLQTAYSRKYIADREFGFVTPVVATESTPDVVTVTVLEFERANQVAAAFESTMNGMVARMILNRSDIDLEETTVDDLGEQAHLYSGIGEGSDEPEYASLLAVQDGNLGILVQAYSPDPSLEDTMMAFATYMVEAEPGTGEVTITETGATGGTFDIMPGAEETDILNGLVPMYDYDLLLDGGSHPLGDDGHGHDHDGTPEASPAP